MSTITFATTADEDAAILALTNESPTEFVTRHVRHQIDFALSQVRESVQVQYDKAPAEDKAAIDAILSKTKGPKP